MTDELLEVLRRAVEGGMFDGFSERWFRSEGPCPPHCAEDAEILRAVVGRALTLLDRRRFTRAEFDVVVEETLYKPSEANADCYGSTQSAFCWSRFHDRKWDGIK